MKIRDKVLPVLRPLGGEEEIASLRESIESGWWGKGPKVAEFEKKVCRDGWCKNMHLLLIVIHQDKT